jgi:hypothetical protein
MRSSGSSKEKFQVWTCRFIRARVITSVLRVFGFSKNHWFQLVIYFRIGVLLGLVLWKISESQNHWSWLFLQLTCDFHERIGKEMMIFSRPIVSVFFNFENCDHIYQNQVFEFFSEETWLWILRNRTDNHQGSVSASNKCPQHSRHSMTRYLFQFLLGFVESLCYKIRRDVVH